MSDSGVIEARVIGHVIGTRTGLRPRPCRGTPVRLPKNWASHQPRGKRSWLPLNCLVSPVIVRYRAGRCLAQVS
jgi:hypothetical protein